ncbi:TPA: ead/Ea22-like family protein [Salmonella enterica subsp. enterica serovar Saintpaul str. CFSAN004160]|nr:ead/Ea22-like family protein [Salmonella enterica subsp. enterica serovar Saintpaul str. CFSAN004160]
MTIDKQALRERYSPKPVPECHICGEEMTIQRMSASRITYGCTGATYDDKGCHYAEGRSIADDHYEQSRVTVVDVSDPDVLALLDENLQLQREKDAIEAVALALRDDMRQARELWRNQTDDVIQFRQHIAELEAKLANPVLLPKTNGYWNEQEKAYEEAITLARRQIRLAGFRCEGDE